jgi:hypothetical protein
MNITYTVPKKKYNRITYRIGGILFLAIAISQLITVLQGRNLRPMITAFFVLILGSYGIYLIAFSLKKQAFDLSYTFTDEGVDVKHHYGEIHYDFSDIEFVTMVIADEALTYYVLNLKTKKDRYTIPFPHKGELCEKIYNHINENIKHLEENE